LKTSDLNINILTHGACMSSGVIILMAGNKRMSMPNCQFLVHYGQDSSYSGTEVKHNANITKLMVQIIADGSGKSVRSIKGWIDKETYFNPNQALKAGLIQGVHDGE